MSDETSDTTSDERPNGPPGARPEDLRREHARVPASDDVLPDTAAGPDDETLPPPATDERRMPAHPVPPRRTPDGR